MSFKCDKCGKVQPPRSKPVRLVTEYRDKVYPPRFDSNHVCIDNGGKGREIVGETIYCQPCALRR